MVRVVKVNGLRTPEQRAGVVYVGRAFAGWPASPWGNPFRPGQGFNAVERFDEWFAKKPDAAELLRQLWNATGQGAKPLGCWCVNARVGDGQPEVCHAQVLARLLTEMQSLIRPTGA